MAYPFGSIPLASVVQRLCDHYGCERRVGPQIIGPRGPVTPTYLYRFSDGRAHVAPLPEVEPSFDLLPSVVRSLCAQLGLDLHNTDFGILSSGIDDDDDDDDDSDQHPILGDRSKLS